MTDDNPQLQKTVLVIACSGSPVMSVVSTVLSSWKLECAQDNDEALVLVEKTDFDLVITDQASSGREDVELLRKVRLARPHTRVIIVTDKSTRADVIAAMRAQAFSYLQSRFPRVLLKRCCNWRRRALIGTRRLKSCPGQMRGYVFRCAVTYQRRIACISSLANFWICPKLTRRRWQQRAEKCCSTRWSMAGGLIRNGVSRLPSSARVMWCSSALRILAKDSL